MRIAAYALMGDPAWVRDSLRSIYDVADRIYLVYDEDGRSWSGDDLDVQESLDLAHAVDREGKLVEVPGRFSDPSRPRLDLETEQRQVGLDRAGEDADWVLQLDTDEVLGSGPQLVRRLRAADARGADSLLYPMRYLVQRTTRGRFVERSGRFWGPRASYPGPIAMRSGTLLRHCRQGGVAPYRVDFRPWSTDPAYPRRSRVDAVILPRDAIWHLAWVRTLAQLRAKILVSGHAGENRPAVVNEGQWIELGERARSVALTTPFHRGSTRRVRVVAGPAGLESHDWYGADTTVRR